MKTKVISAMKIASISAIIIAALGLAGRSDYEDARIVEMKDNGSYYELSEQFPDATDSELIKIYEDR